LPRRSQCKVLGIQNSWNNRPICEQASRWPLDHDTASLLRQGFRIGHITVQFSQRPHPLPPSPARGRGGRG
jgi:hypothetical protein